MEMNFMFFCYNEPESEMKVHMFWQMPSCLFLASTEKEDGLKGQKRMEKRTEQKNRTWNMEHIKIMAGKQRFDIKEDN